jgi:hypothetical protein
MRAAGYALAELLVAVAIAGLIVSSLMFLNVDYVGFARRVVDIQGPFAMGRRAEASGNLDRCADPGATLTPGENQVVAQDRKQAATVLTLAANGDVTTLVTPQGSAGKSSHPVRIIVQSAPAPGGSMASIEVGDATVGVIATRCELAELCDYDVTNATCREPDTNAAEGNATDATNAAAAGDSLAGHG